MITTPLCDINLFALGSLNAIFRINFHINQDFSPFFLILKKIKKSSCRAITSKMPVLMLHFTFRQRDFFFLFFFQITLTTGVIAFQKFTLLTNSQTPDKYSTHTTSSFVSKKMLFLLQLTFANTQELLISSNLCEYRMKALLAIFHARKTPEHQSQLTNRAASSTERLFCKQESSGKPSLLEISLTRYSPGEGGLAGSAASKNKTHFSAVSALPTVAVSHEHIEDIFPWVESKSNYVENEFSRID